MERKEARSCRILLVRIHNHCLDCLHIYMWAKKKAAKLTVSVIKRGPISECFKGSLLKGSHGYHLNVPVFMALSSTLS